MEEARVGVNHGGGGGGRAGGVCVLALVLHAVVPKLSRISLYSIFNRLHGETIWESITFHGCQFVYQVHLETPSPPTLVGYTEAKGESSTLLGIV